MFRPLRILLIILLSGIVFFSWSCGSNTAGNTAGSAEFAPNPATVASGQCTSTARIVEISGNVLSLVSGTALFTGGNGGTARFDFTPTQLSAAFGTGTLPANGTVAGSFTFDLGSASLALPANGTFVVIGTGARVVTTFVGTLQCEGA